MKLFGCKRCHLVLLVSVCAAVMGRSRSSDVLRMILVVQSGAELRGLEAVVWPVKLVSSKAAEKHNPTADG